jgi:hypothetical protein
MSMKLRDLFGHVMFSQHEAYEVVEFAIQQAKEQPGYETIAHQLEDAKQSAATGSEAWGGIGLVIVHEREGLVELIGQQRVDGVRSYVDSLFTATRDRPITKNQFVALLVGGIAVTGVVYLIAFDLTMVLAPRAGENGRVVVTMPWPWFATLPSLVAATIGLGMGLSLSGTTKHRIAFLLGTMAAVFLLTNGCVDLLRRDYIGKF